MPAQSRLGDMGVGICCCHSDPTCIGMVGILITGSPNHNTNSLATARKYDIMLGFCGHIGQMITSSNTAEVNNKGMVRIGDQFTGCFRGVVVSGSPNTTTGN